MQNGATDDGPSPWSRRTGRPIVDFALAYIDPGSGSLLIQVIIASLLAVPYFLRQQIGRAVNLVRGRGRSEPAATTASDEATGSEPS
jgi:hypothetical protein